MIWRAQARAAVPQAAVKQARGANSIGPEQQRDAYVSGG